MDLYTLVVDKVLIVINAHIDDFFIFFILWILTIFRAVMQAKDLFPYEKNKEKFSKNSNRSRRGFKEALVEIVENPKVRWGMRGQEEDEEDEDDEDDEEEEDEEEENKDDSEEEQESEEEEQKAEKKSKQSKQNQV